MEKFIFLATVKDRLTDLNVPEEIIEKHLQTFEDCFNGRSSDEVDSIINGAGGIEGIIQSIYDLESAKGNADTDQNTTETPKTDSNTDAETDKSNTSSKDDIDTAPTGETPVQNSELVIEKEQLFSDENTVDEPSTDDMTKEIPASAVLSEHIKEAEELSDTMEKTAINNVIKDGSEVEYSEEFSAEFSDYDFETLFAEKLTFPEKWAITIKEKLSPKAFKYTTPIAGIVFGILYLFVTLLLVLLFASAIAFAVAYIGILIGGVAFAAVPMGYGAYVYFFGSALPVALYELGVGIAALGATMLTSILLYNYVRRLVPFLFKQIKKLYKLCNRITKRYFQKTVKEEN